MLGHIPQIRSMGNSAKEPLSAFRGHTYGWPAQRRMNWHGKQGSSVWKTA
jgi:hypothetical protein